MKILIGTVTHKAKDYCREEFNLGIYNIVANTPGKYYCEIIHTDNFKGNSRERVTEGYNQLLKFFLENDFDYLLTLESDIIPPPQIIDLLLRHKKEICGATYMVGFKRDRVPCIFIGNTYKRKIGNEYKSFLENIKPNELNGELIHAKGGCGLGCCLIHKSVFDKVKKFRHEEAHCDTYFHKDAQEAGFKTMVDTGIICKHYGSAEDWQEAIHKGDF